MFNDDQLFVSNVESVSIDFISPIQSEGLMLLPFHVNHIQNICKGKLKKFYAYLRAKKTPIDAIGPLLDTEKELLVDLFIF